MEGVDDAADDADQSTRPCAELIGTELEWSTIRSDDKHNVKSKACVFCGLKYAGGPAHIRQHLDKSVKPRHVKACQPGINHFQRHAEVVTVLRERAAEVRRKEDLRTNRDKAKGLVAAMNTSTPGDLNSALLMRPKPEQVTEQWMRALVKKGLPLDLADDDEFRAAVLITARAGLTYVDAQKGDSKLPHRTHMTNKELPKLDDKLDAKVAKKINGLIKETGAMLISDGWTSVQARPIINALLATPAGSKFVQALDTSGEIKDARFIADFIIKIIECVGPENIVAVCMDGACKASFELITAHFPHVFCFICPTHSVDNFLKNVCSDNETIKVKSIEGDFDWGSSIFSEPIAQSWEVIKFITNHSKPLSIFRKIVADPTTWSDAELPQPSFCELIKHCDTRFASNVMMLQRYIALQVVVEAMVANPVYKLWLSKQKVESRLKGEEIRSTVQDADHWAGVSLTVRVLLPALKLLRLTDGKTGATLGKVYALFSEVDASYTGEIAGVDEETLERMHQLFLARWTYFHEPVFTGAHFLDSEFIKDVHTPEEQGEFRAVLKQMALTPGCPHKYSDMLGQWAALQTALAVESHGLDDTEAFAAGSCDMPAFEWARTFMFYWPAIQWVALRLTALACSASGCEHSWSIEGWIHSKKRNRLGQTNVERLVRTHTNLLLDGCLAEWRASALPWEIEMIIEEPELEIE